MKYMTITAFAVSVLGSGSALAGAPYGCGSHLSPQAKMVFDAVDSGPQQGTLRDRLEKETRKLVMDGDLKRADARPAAEEASACLRAH
jgi:hypothetical protein